ncbi:MAG: hypothetical protein VX705_02075 [Verrucomicrobiota bacterium]|nr:hypothetical protein [Verrucomicrobiota bacterium]
MKDFSSNKIVRRLGVASDESVLATSRDGGHTARLKPQFHDEHDIE